MSEPNDPTRPVDLTGPTDVIRLDGVEGVVDTGSVLVTDPPADLPGGVSAEMPHWDLDVALDDDWPATPDVVETRAMDLTELAVEVTAPPDAEPEAVLPRRSIDIALDPPHYADDPIVDAAVGPDDVATAAGVGETAAGDDIDPRLRERRETVASSRRRRVLKRLGLAGLVALAGLLAYAFVYSPVLDVDRVDIVGSTQLTTAQLRSEAGLAVGDPIVFADPSRIAARLRRDPRFVRVAVMRRFPSTISIRLTDRRVIAILVGPTRSVVVGEDGVVIGEARGDEMVRHVTVTKDPTTRVGGQVPAPTAAAIDVLGSMSYEVAVQVHEMQITDEGELVFDLGDHRTVLFGTVDEADAKLLAIRTMLGPSVDLRDMCQLDVRVPTAPTMRRTPSCNPPVAPPTTALPADATAPPADPAAATPLAANPAATDPATPSTSPSTTPSPSTSTPASG